MLAAAEECDSILVNHYCENEDLGFKCKMLNIDLGLSNLNGV